MTDHLISLLCGHIWAFLMSSLIAWHHDENFVIGGMVRLNVLASSYLILQHERLAVRTTHCIRQFILEVICYLQLIVIKLGEQELV
jgi:hypothetical protein